MGAGVEKDRIDQAGRERRSDHRLLEQPPDDQKDAQRRRLAAEIGPALELGDEVGAADDGSGDQMGEEDISSVTFSRLAAGSLPR